MIRRTLIVVFCAATLYVFFSNTQVSAQQPPQQLQYGRLWNTSTVEDWQRHYHYPYKYYPQNFQSPETYQAAPGKYPKEMQVPPYYDRNWQNYYPSPRKYHFGHHFELDAIR